MSILSNIASIALAAIGIYLAYYRETIERKLRRDTLFKILKTNPPVKTYHEGVYNELVR